MKRTITHLAITLVAVLCLTGCNNFKETHVTEVDHPDKAVEFEYKGHKYIMFEKYGTAPRGDMTGVVHDPDCPCHNLEKE